MNRIPDYLLIAFLQIGHLALGANGGSALGVATAKGEFAVDRAAMPGNATLFDGSRVETQKVSSWLQLKNGVRLQLGAESGGTVYRDRTIFERGQMNAEDLGTYQIEALSLRIRGERNSAIQVTMPNQRVLQVAAVRGPVRVLKPDGVVVANLAQGGVVSLTPESSGAVAPSTITGCVDGKDVLFLVDEVSGVRFRLDGESLGAYEGRRVEATGSVSNEADSGNALKVMRVKPLEGKCSSKQAGAAAGGAAAAGAAKGGTAGAGAAAAKAGAGAAAAKVAGVTLASKAVIAGVVVAGVATGTAVAVIDDQPEAISPSAR
ncbi:MAG: hypothetical protein ACKV22_27135 [Bryobacteraceae bacterium]